MVETATAATRVDGAVRSIARAVEVLELFDEHHPSRQLREIVASTELPKTTVVRLLATLESLGLIVGRSDSTYGPGPGFLRWVKLADSLWEVGEQAKKAMSSLVDAYGETVNIYIRQGINRVAVAQIEGTATVRSVVEVGVPYPLATGASAKILLIDAPEGVLHDVAEHHSDRTREELEQEIDAVRDAGYAVTHGERELGASAVAAPILGPDGRVIAAMSISGPTSRFSAERVAHYVDAVIAAARQVSENGLGPVEVFL
ncbi:IclR family transcriptional regulator [Nocardia pseudovaccinii]|uniref:IclR family transcriptional regulator n=1 Tax=Nocardia pseudovaccinii TaxID=189540 RepID=UPI0007A4E08D|nr:IclR family transcriptional regulator [Nocardia pseudovaccinii]